MDRRRVLIAVALAIPLAASAGQGAPVYTSVPSYPTAGSACSGSRVQLQANNGAPWCCVSGHWQVCAAFDAGGVSTVTATGSTTPRMLADRFADVVNAKDFGAKGDGATDDTAALTAWLAAAAGKNAYAPEGTYRAVNVPIPSNVTVYGAGMGRTIFKLLDSSAAAAAVLKNSDQTSGNSGITLREFTVDGNKANQTNTGQMGIYFSKVSKSAIRGVEVKNTMGLAASGIQWSTASDNTPNYDNEVSGCYVHDCGLSAVNNADGLAIGGVRLRIFGNHFANNTDTGVGLQGNGTTNVVIANNVMQGQLGIAAGPGVNANQNITITGNTISGSAVWGIYLDDVTKFQITGNDLVIATGATTPAAIHVENSTQGTISGNTIANSAFHGMYLVATGTSTLSDISVTGNVVRGVNSDGIRLDSAAAGATVRSVTISGNTIKNNSQGSASTNDGLGIYATGTVTGIAVIGNTLSDDQVSPTQRYGFAVGGTPTALSVGGNIITGNASGAFSGLPSSVRLSPNFTGSASSATANAGDRVSIGDTTDMPNSSTRVMDVWGRDAGGNYRVGRILNDGSAFWVGNNASNLGLKVGILAGDVSLIAGGSSQGIGLTTSGGNVSVSGGGLSPSTDAAASQTGHVFQGSGIPSNSNGGNGDVYFRTDTPGTTNQRVYVKSSGSWIGIL